MEEKFKDQSSFFVAFAAVVISLAAFKDELIAYHIQLAGWYPTALGLFTPTVLLLLLAMYITALKMLVDNLNFIRIPISGFLAWSAVTINIFAIVGWPLTVGVILLGSWVFDNTDTGSMLQAVSAIVPTILAALVSAMASGNIRKQRQLQDAIAAGNSLRPDASPLTPHANNGNQVLYEYFKEYEYLLEYMRGYLGLLGYGAKSMPFYRVATILYRKEVISRADFENVKSLTEFRNNIAHGKKSAPVDELEKNINLIRLLRQNIQSAYTQFIENNNDGSTN